MGFPTKNDHFVVEIGAPFKETPICTKQISELGSNEMCGVFGGGGTIVDQMLLWIPRTKY